MDLGLLKALKLLDLGRFVQAEQLLLELLVSPQSTLETVLTANCVLGDLYASQGDWERARPHLEAVLAVDLSDDRLAAEQARARELLGELRNEPTK